MEITAYVSFHYYWYVKIVQIAILKMCSILISVNQMTAVRISGSQCIRSNLERGKGRLEGLTGIVEDWHAKVIVLGVCCNIIISS